MNPKFQKQKTQMEISVVLHSLSGFSKLRYYFIQIGCQINQFDTIDDILISGFSNRMNFRSVEIQIT